MKPIRVNGIAVAEGVRFEYGDTTATAVRNERGGISVRVRRDSRVLRRAVDRIPLVRGALRIFTGLGDSLSSLADSGRMDPRRAIRGSEYLQVFAHLFSTHPQSLAALANALTMIVITAVWMLLLPWLIGFGLNLIPDMPSLAVNIICCLFRLFGAVVSVYMICHLRVIRRLCMYRGAMGKVMNAYEAYGPRLTASEARISPRQTDRSDGVFLLLTALLSIVVFAALPPAGLAAQILSRAGVLLASGAVVNELIRPLEKALPGSRLADAHAQLSTLQDIFTIEPHEKMIDVAVAAFRAACGDEGLEEDEGDDADERTAEHERP